VSAAEYDQKYGPLALYVYAWVEAPGTPCRRCKRPSLQRVSVIRHRPCGWSGRDCDLLHHIDACCGAFFTAPDDPRAAVVTFVCDACLVTWWGDLEMIWPDGTAQTPRQRLGPQELKPSA
jgi:hypothetical protein